MTYLKTQPLTQSLRGKIAAKRTPPQVRIITREDLPRILKPRDATDSVPKRLRESHHAVARFLSLGFPYKRIAALTGYSENRVFQLSQAPAMKELVANYQAKADEAFLESQDTFFELATGNMIAAERHLADRIAELDETGDLLSVREALAISRDAADRFGYGKKQTNLNVNADFAALLEKAIARSGKSIDGVLVPPGHSHQAAGARTPPVPAPAATLRRLN